MVRMMDKFLCKFRDNFINEKEFLSLDDVCYIFNKNGGDFHIDSEQQHEAERDYNRLKSVLYDLVTHNRITPVFCFDGKYEPYSYTVMLDNDVNEFGETITIEREKQILNDGLYPKTDYIYLPRIYFKRLFTTNHNIQLSPLDNLNFYRYPPSEQLGDRYFKFYDYKNFKINPDSYIWFNDLCYPKEQILALFGAHKIKADNAELVQQLQAEIAKIKQEKLEAIQGYKDAYSDYLEKYKQEVSVLKGHLEQQAQDKQATINRLTNELNQANAQIAELEQQAGKVSDKAANTQALPFFDENNIYTYPPELDMAIKIWCELYKDKDIHSEVFSHTEIFNRAVRKLGFDLRTADKPNGITEADNTKRIRRITTPQQNKDKTRN